MNASVSISYSQLLILPHLPLSIRLVCVLSVLGDPGNIIMHLWRMGALLYNTVSLLREPASISSCHQHQIGIRQQPTPGSPQLSLGALFQAVLAGFSFPAPVVSLTLDPSPPPAVWLSPHSGTPVLSSTLAPPSWCQSWKTVSRRARCPLAADAFV